MLVAAFAATGWAVSGLGEEFLPDFQENDFLMHWVEKPGTSLEAMRRITVNVSKELRSVPDVRNFGSHIGRAEVADEVVGPNFTELWISVDPKADHAPTLTKIEKIVAGYPGLYQDVLTYLKERIKEVLTGAGATVVVRIFGPDMAVLRAKAQEIAKVMEPIEGVTNLKVEPQLLVPQLDVRLRPEASARLGLTAGDVRRAATTLVKGLKVGELYRDQKIFDVFVWGVEEVRNDISKLSQLADRDAAGHARPAVRRRRHRARAGSQRDQARGGLAADRRDLQRRRGATWAASPARSKNGSGLSISTASTTPSSSASTPPARSRAAGCWPWPRSRCSASC